MVVTKMSVTAAAARPPVRRRAGRHWSRYRAGYLFVLPAFLLYAVFMIYPFLQSIYFTFIEWNGADPRRSRPDSVSSPRRDGTHARRRPSR